ncbi:MAG: VOC family protein [Pseudomonadota bacterium]
MGTTDIDGGTTAKVGIGAIRSLDYVFLLCDDLERMKRFYLDLFELQIEEDIPGRMVEFRLGSLFLGLRARGRQYDGPQIPGPSAAVQLSFRVPPTDVDLAYETLKAKDIEVIEAPTDQDWPHRTLYFKDPENNILEIFADIHVQQTAPAPSGAHGLVDR